MSHSPALPGARVGEWEIAGAGPDDKRYIYLQAARGRPVAIVKPDLTIAQMRFNAATGGSNLRPWEVRAMIQDLGAIFDEHLRAEFEMHDAAATMDTMSAQPHLYHLPTMTGGNGRDEIFEFYRDNFVNRWPADTATTQISRTVGSDQIVDELVMNFTHDVEMDALLPGVPPTGKRVSLPVVVVVKFREGKVAHEHIYWDQACLLVQVGLLDPSVLPVTGAEQARNLLDGSYATNVLLPQRG